MAILSKKEPSLKFLDTVGRFSVLNDTVFLPKLTAFKNLSGLKEAEEKLSLLSTIAFSEKTIITHGTIHKREYLFFYSNKGYFDSNRVFNNKLDSLSFFSYEGLRLAVLLARELKPMLEIRQDIKKFFNHSELKDKKPRMALVFEADQMEMNTTIMGYHINDIFEETEVVFFLGENFIDIQQKKGTMLLC
jgi:hypothetical protein